MRQLRGGPRSAGWKGASFGGGLDDSGGSASEAAKVTNNYADVDPNTNF